jgi:acetyl-CoA C-acetyltransferase
MKDVYVVGAVRTPIGGYLGGFQYTSAADLGVAAVKEALSRAAVEPARVDEFIFGNARQAGSGPNIARQIAYRAGIPQESPSYTVNKACGSALKSIIHGYQAIVLDEVDLVVAGGTENMTRVPFMFEDFRWGYRMGNAKVIDGMYRDGFICPLVDAPMGSTAETLAEMYKIGREEQDEYAMQTQHRTQAAVEDGRMAQEIFPVEAADARGRPHVVEADEHPRKGVTMEKLAKLPTVFKKDGTVTAGNSSGITDGAAAVVLTHEAIVKELNLKPLARIGHYASAGVDPAIMGIGVVPACQRLFERSGLTLDDFDLIELNEAFAAQVLAVDRDLHLDMSKVNVNGGSIALGHPIGATGARIVVTLLYEMRRRKAKRGLATLCISGGMGMAMDFELA